MLHKTRLLSLITLVVWSFSLIMPLSAAEPKTIILDVPGMTCKFCPITIRKALQNVPGVIKATADYDTKSATVTFDPDKTTTDTLMKTTANAGYPSTLKK